MTVTVTVTTRYLAAAVAGTLISDGKVERVSSGASLTMGPNPH